MLESIVFIELHKSQLESSAVPKHFWNTLYGKLQGSVFDANEVFTLFKIDYEIERGQYDPPWQLRVNAESGIKADDPKHIYLIDHAWTFRTETARKQLQEINSLAGRMASIVGLDCKKLTEEFSDDIFNELWKYSNFYWTQNAENVQDQIPVWYIMDEVGSAIQHSETPNFRMVPFVHIPEQIVYSIIFPITDVNYDDIVTRNFVEKLTNNVKERLALTLPWIYTSFYNESFLHEKASPDYFLSGHLKESLPILENLKTFPNVKSKYRVFTEYDLICKYLTNECFEIINDEDEADILWYTRHFRDFENLSENCSKYVNQFPFEYVLTVKDLLCIICRRNKVNNDISLLNLSPCWLPITYNLKTELIQFVSHYQHRENKNLDNHWIIKPFNLARGLDMHITNNLNYILRLPLTGPKVAQKYIDNPVLFYRSECSGKVKFDIRYVILLKSVNPLEAYAYKNFFLRFANRPFELNNFDDYSKHFTVMNYVDNAINLKHMLCQDFIKEWYQQYPNISWDVIEKSIMDMLKEVLKCATMEYPPCGISESPQSRAIYAADIMLEWKNDNDVQPKLLEINWTPDCKRACEYYPDFFNDIFKLFFLNVQNVDVFYQL